MSAATTRKRTRVNQQNGRNRGSWIALAIVLSQLSTFRVNALTVTTFNMLAPVHRSMDAANTRESENEKWWKPRAECIGDFISNELACSDVILLQEWWFRDEFVDLFDSLTSHKFHRVAEQRPSGIMAPPPPTSAVVPTSSADGILTKMNNNPSLLRQSPSSMREDGMAVLVKKGGNLEIIESTKVLTGPSRIGQLVHCRERDTKRDVMIGNAHLSFPSHADPSINDRRQAHEVELVSRALSNFKPNDNNNRLELIGGDFNSNSRGLAAKKLESNNFVNCASASSEQALSSWGGQINLGVTHRTHRGEDVSVDHIFARVRGETVSSSSTSSKATAAAASSPALRLGYLDMQGTRVVDCHRGELQLDGNFVMSDHRPVTATLECPPCRQRSGFGFLGMDTDDNRDFARGSTSGGIYFKDAPDMSGLVHQPLDPLEPPSYMGMSMRTE